MSPLAAQDHTGRLARLRSAIAERDLDGFVVSDLTNLRYLTGFTGSNGQAIVTDDAVVVCTDGRYRTQVRDQLAATFGDAAAEIDVRIAADLDEPLFEAVQGRSRVGVEADVIAWSTARRWQAEGPGPELVPTDRILLEHRAVKDEGEIDRLRRACAIADAALAEVAPLLQDGLTEVAFRRRLEGAMDDLGSDGPSFETIVASGPNSARPHARPTDRVIGSSGRGEFVVVDFGATCDGYHSDMTRTFAVGALTAVQREIHDTVAAAQRAGVAAVRAGVSTRAVDAVCRDHITAAGWGDAFSHGTGHGIGLVIHEQPRLSTLSGDLLAPGHCITVEPGIYDLAHGGVRIEDSVVVTATGHDPLTEAPYPTL